MASTWSGFTDEDLRKLKSPNDFDGGSAALGRRKAPTTQARPQRVVPPMKKETTSDEPLPTAALLAAPMLSVREADAATAVSNTQPLTQSDSLRAASGKSQADGLEGTLAPSSPSVAVPLTVQLAIVSDADGVTRELSSLQDFQQQQKMMEELNNKKKQMLSKEIAQRQKRATAEAHKLKAIQSELSKLDQLLNTDVSLIRDRIEEATREYTDARKRFEAAEKEYIEAKLSVQKKGVLKEQLTEHLYTIINQNELRKAKKLAELMAKLDMDSELLPPNGTELASSSSDESHQRAVSSGGNAPVPSLTKQAEDRTASANPEPVCNSAS